MGDSSSIRAREIEAEVAVERAKNGDLVKLGRYRLRDRPDRGAVIKIKNVLIENSEAKPGQDLTVFGDFQNGLVVVDLESGGDSDGK